MNIFFTDGPDFNWKEAEFNLLKSFEASLTPEEKQDVKIYLDYLQWDTKEAESRRRRNLAVMCFIDGIRYNKRKKNNGLIVDPVFVQALFQTAVDEIAKWSGMEKDTVRLNLNNMTYKRAEEINAENKTPKEEERDRVPKIPNLDI